jgi:hypothetical protein
MSESGREEGYSTRPSMSLPSSPLHQDRTLLSPLDAWEVGVNRRSRGADANANTGKRVDNSRGGWDGGDGGDGLVEMMAETSSSANGGASVPAFRYALRSMGWRLTAGCIMVYCNLRPVLPCFPLISYYNCCRNPLHLPLCLASIHNCMVLALYALSQCADSQRGGVVPGIA